MKISSFSATSFLPEQFNPRKQNIVVVVNNFPENFTGENITKEQSAKINSYHHTTDATAYAWRHHLLNTWLSDFTGTAFSDLEFQFNNEKKPFLKNNEFYFNISRSANHLAFAFGPEPIGVDIEMIRDATAFREVANQHYHAEEKKILAADNSNINFFSIWTRKEALLKAIGTGLTDELHMIDTTSAYHLLNNKRYNSNSFKGSDFLLSVAYQSENIIPVFICNYEIKNSILSDH